MKNRYRIVVLLCFLSFFLQAQWEHIATPQFNDPSGFCDCWYKGAIASNSTYYWAYDVACGQGGSFYSYFKIFRTTDSGINWDLKVTESYTSASLNSMKFISADTGFINRNDMTLSMIERTADGMNSFSNCSYSSFHAFGDLAMINFNNIYALNGNDKSLEHLENNTFNVVYNFPQSIYFGNYTEIEAPGNQFLFLACLTSPYLPQPNNLILKSNDGGNSWDTSYLASTNSIIEICFCNDSIGFAACTEGIILKTEDAGLSWSNKNSGVSANLGAIDYLNDSTWIIAGGLGTIIITYDGGETWNSLISPINSYTIADIRFPEKDSVIVIRASTAFWKTNLNDIITRSKENIPEDQIRIFPNPARNKFSIQVGVELKNASLEIFNVIGEKVYSQKIDSKKEIINCADLPNGIYLVTIENQGKSSIQKLVIQ